MQEIAIEISNLSKQYLLGEASKYKFKSKDSQEVKNNEFYALKNFSTKIFKGDAVGIIGKNGSGKSTLLKMLAKITAPSEGKIALHGKVASMLEIGTGFNPEMTGRENIFMNGAILGMSAQEIKDKFDAIVEFSECEAFIDTPVKRYSSGMYVKLAFSVAAHLDSDILLLDEVLAVGDADFQKKCLEKMMEIAQNENKTIVFVSHNMDNIRKLCNRCIVLNKGEEIWDGSVDDGIGIYVGADKKNKASNAQEDYPVSYDLANLMRPLSFEKKASVLKLDFLGKQKAIFKQSELLQIQLKWQAEEDLSNVRARVVVRRKNTAVPVGLTVSSCIETVEKNHIMETVMALNFGTLAEDDYVFQIVLCHNALDDSTMVPCDIINTSFCFKVLKDENFIFNKWPPEIWGNVVFSEIEIKQL